MERRTSDRRRTTVCAARALILIGALAAAAGAQDLSGIVRDSVTRQPIAGAVLTLRDSSGALVTSRLTDERGEFRIATIGAARTLRIVRIGFEPRTVTLPENMEPGSRLDLTLLALPSMLRPIRVLTNSNCRARKDTPVAMGLWAEARDGLLATVVARERNPASIHRLIFQQLMEGTGDKIESMRVRADSSVDTISFVASRMARDFVQSGFRHDSAGRRTTYGPDAVVLLSDDFAAAYCFQVADGGRTRPREIGIHFHPAVTGDERTDIDGTLWIDTVAREIRDVEYTYLGLPSRMAEYHPGGRVWFRTMPNGVVLVDRWSIRSVGVAADTEWTTGGGAPTFTRRGFGQHGIGDPGGAAQQTLRERLYASVIGGELASASWPDGAAWHAPLGNLRAQVITLGGRPAANALLTLVGTPYFGNTDSNGVVEIGGLVPGPYELHTVVDPRLAEMGIASSPVKRVVAVRDSTVTATLVVTTAENFAAERCAAVARRAPADSVFVLGQVVTNDGRPVVDAKLTFATMNSGVAVWHGERARTSSDGVFLSCVGWKIGDAVLVRVNQTGAGDIDATRTMDSRLLLLRIALPR